MISTPSKNTIIFIFLAIPFLSASFLQQKKSRYFTALSV
nr:MAG TPA: hypothetical protein [Caudoviricetes sp.]